MIKIEKYLTYSLSFKKGDYWYLFQMISICVYVAYIIKG